MRVPPEKKISVLIKTATDQTESIIAAQIDAIKFLTRASEIKYGRDVKKPPSSGSGVGNGVEVYVPLKGIIDIEKEMERLNKELVKLENDIMRSERKLGNEDFLNKAPKDVVEREKKALEESISARERLKSLLDSLKV